MPATAHGARRRGALALAVASALAARGAGALADDPPEGTAVIRTDGPARDAARVEGGTSFATSIDTRDRGPTAESLADLLGEAPGLHVRRQGDGFAPQSVTLRGAPAAQVTVALDGVVLNDAASDGVDLSLVPPALVERVDVYRGSAPLRLGVSGLGGAVELTTRRLPTRPLAWVSLGAGSFGAVRASALTGGRYGRWSALSAVGYRGTRGDFAYYDVGGLPLSGQGTTSARQNNAAEAADALDRACYAVSTETTACALLVGGWRSRQIAGPNDFGLTGAPYAEQGRLLARAGVTHRRGAGQFEVFTAAILRDDHFANRSATDPGRPALAGTAVTDARSTTWSVEAGATGEFHARALTVRAVARGRAERYVPHGADAGADASRQGVLAGVETSLALGALTLAPAASVEALADRGGGGGGEGAGARALASPRVGARLQIAPWMELRASGGHAERAPTLPELYGDRGVIVGAPGLRPEIADHADGGAVLTLTRRNVLLRAEASAYARRVRDMIVLVQTSRSTFTPANLDSASVAGAEFALRFTWGRYVRASAAYAYTDARTPLPDGTNARVPGVPLHDLYGAVSGTLGPVTLSVDASYVSEAFLDKVNLAAIPARLLVGLSAAVVPPFARGFTVSATITNLLDARTAQVPVPVGIPVTAPIQDFFGYPLPGRAIFIALTARTEAP